MLASNADLESGFSREVFLMWASKPKNSIILTDRYIKIKIVLMINILTPIFKIFLYFFSIYLYYRTAPDTLARDLIDEGGDRNIKLIVKKRVPLEDNELEEYNIKHDAEKVEASKKYYNYSFMF